MSIDCSKNPLLEKLEAKQAELDALVSNLASVGSAGMAALKAKADEMVSALTDMIPSLPEIPNFKKELQELAGKVGKELAEAKAALKERWGEALPDIDIDGLMNKVSAAKSLIDNFEEDLTDFATGLAGKVADKFDFCKDAPNIDAPEVVDGKVIKVIDKGAEPTTPAEVPVVVETVTPTIVAKEKEPSVSGLTTKSYSELLEAKQPYDDAIATFKDSYLPPLKEWTDRTTKLKKTKEWKKLDKRILRKKMKYAEYYNSEADDTEKKLIDDYYSGYEEATTALAARFRVDMASGYYSILQFEDKWSDWPEATALNSILRNKEVKRVRFSLNNKLIITTEEFNTKEVDSQVKSIFQQYEKEIIEYQNYRAAKSGD